MPRRLVTVSRMGEAPVGMWLCAEGEVEDAVSVKVMVYLFCAPWRRGCHSSGLESSVVLR